MEKIVITGIGVVSPLGCSLDQVWQNMTAGVSGIDTLDHFEGLPVTFGGAAKDFDPERYIGRKELRHMDRYSQMAVTAGLDAAQQAGLVGAYDPDRVGVMVGTGSGGMDTIEKQVTNFSERGARRISPLAVPMFIVNMASGLLAQHLDVHGPGMCISTACSTGGHSLAMAQRLIQAGDADCMLAGGVEACLTPFGISSFASMRALSTRNDDPRRASRPFDVNRDGFVMGEGGAVFVLEKESAARKRGVRILATLAGSGMSLDAYHMVAPDPDAKAVIAGIKRALEVAGIAPEEIGYVNAHGTSTPLNDRTETYALKQVFGAHAAKLNISSTKSMTGHLIGGTAALETAACIMALNTGVIPPTINLDDPDPDCDLNYTPHQAVEVEGLKYALNNAFGFGGQNVALIIGKGEA